MSTECEPKDLNYNKHLTPKQKIIELLKLYYLARELKRARLKALNPNIKTEELDKKKAEIFLLGNEKEKGIKFYWEIIIYCTS